jgi:NMD protein affecting ribosome stability and mRNA decay
MTCHRCGEHTPRLTLSQRYCPRCEREVAALLPHPAPANLPEWRRRDLARDMTRASA